MAIQHARTEHVALGRNRYRFTVDQYRRMGEASIFRKNDRVELIDGAIIEMPLIEAAHQDGVGRLLRDLSKHATGEAVIAFESPLHMTEFDEPVPDGLVLRNRTDQYGHGRIAPEDVLLLIEVADSSVSYDRRVKAPLYARNGIPEYWLVDLGRGQVVVYRDPSPDGYRSMHVHQRGASLSLVELPDVTIAVADILGGPAESA